MPVVTFDGGVVHLTSFNTACGWPSVRVTGLAPSGRRGTQDPTVVLDGAKSEQQLVVHMLSPPPVHAIVGWVNQNRRPAACERRRHGGSVEVITDRDAECSLIDRENGTLSAGHSVREQGH